MAFKSLDNLRTLIPGLNSELGLDTDTDNSFGTTAQRNGYLQRAFTKLWPKMGRLTRETVLTITDKQEYTLTTLVDIERLEVLDLATGTLRSDRIRSWQFYADEAADPPTLRLTIPAMIAGITIYAIGYAPYLVPANGAALCDLPPRLEHVVTSGARVEAYRAKLNMFANFERHANENRANALSAADIIELLRQSSREFDRAMGENQRSLSGAHRARLQTG